MKCTVSAHHRKGHMVSQHSREIPGGRKKKAGDGKEMEKKKHSKGILKALGEKKSTGNFKKIEEKKGKAAAIGALQNKLAKRRGQPVPYGK